MGDYFKQLTSARTPYTVSYHRVPDAPVLPLTDADRRLADMHTDPIDRSQPAQAVETLRRHGLVDADWYLARNPDVAAAGLDPVEHFMHQGYKEGRQPNPYFDCRWYQQRYPEATEAGANPLLHYIQVGERAGHKPIVYFDPGWYRSRYDVAEDQSCLRHYLTHRASGRYSPNAAFDPDYYLHTYPDVAGAPVDPFEHYISHGWREGRNPSADFDTAFYRRRYLAGQPDANPLEHYLTQPQPETLCTHPATEVSVFSDIRRFTRPGAGFEERLPLPPGTVPRAKLLAFYLPQFHHVTENDRWWGRGFTEWTNLARGTPRFAGHYQPRVPRDLGFYDLSSAETLRRQIQLAQDAGIFGFVFYFYWFNGRRLLEAPLERFLDTPDMRMPFALLWANENWTRRWDGSEQDVLISQDYRVEDEDALLATWARHFADDRYIRVDGRPLLMIYRPALIPETARTIARWRAKLADLHDEAPLIFMAQCFGSADPTDYGLDGALEFPPHKLAQDLPHINDTLLAYDANLSAAVVNYEDVVARSLDEPAPDYPLIKTIVPSWDNDARRQGTGMVLHGSTPARYEAWLAELIRRAVRRPVHGEPFVCINAWNEWAEGAYLEPDLHFGAAYLNATARAVAGLPSVSAMSRLLLVGHDAHPHGAQMLLLNIGRVLKRGFGIQVEFLLLEGGPLLADYAAVAPTAVAATEREQREKCLDLHRRGFLQAIVNTSAAGHMARTLAEAGIGSIALVHEMPRLLIEKRLLPAAAAIALHARRAFFPAPVVRDRFLELCPEMRATPVVMPQGSYSRIAATPDLRARMRAELGVADDEFVAIALGYADLRKGFDLFIQVAKIMHRRDPRWHFVWVGRVDPATTQYLALDLSHAVERHRLRLIPFTSDVAPYLAAADLYLLTSREDPFPTVVLEAWQAGVPAVAFADSGGMPDVILERDAGAVVEFGDTDAMARAMSALTAITPAATEARRERLRAIATDYAFQPYVAGLLRHAQESLLSISVVVPSFNYARYMHRRLSSIFGQTYPVREVIVLDDASADDSVAEIERAAADWQRDIVLVTNARNSGSPFTQWRDGVQRASGDYVWIAEADDDSDPRFLEKLAALMAGRPDMMMAFCDSAAIDGEGRLLGASYKGYYSEVEPGLLAEDGIFDARAFVGRALAVQNLILNVSAVLWRRDALLDGMRRCVGLPDYRVAGDWYLYVDILTAAPGCVGYSAEPLNMHRRHPGSVTHALAARRHGDEIERVQRFIQRSLGDDPERTRRQDAYLRTVRGSLRQRARRRPGPERAKLAAGDD